MGDPSVNRDALSHQSEDRWRDRTLTLSALFLAAVRESLPQQAVSAVSICYRYVAQTADELGIPQGCVRVEILRPCSDPFPRSSLVLSSDLERASELSAGELRLAGSPADQSADR